MKRRKVDKKSTEDIAIINLEENIKRERGSNKSKEKREKSSYDELDVRKEKRASRKRP